MIRLTEIREALALRLAKARPMPCHVAAFAGWIIRDIDCLKSAVAEAVGFTGQARHPEHIAALGFGATAKQLSNADLQILREEVQHLGGRAFFSAGRPLRFEVDGIALLGVAFGAAHAVQADDREWLEKLLERSSSEVATDAWQLGLMRLARLAIGERDLRIVPPDLAVAAAARGLGDVRDNDRENAWKMAVEFLPHDSGPGRDAARLAAFQSEFARLGQIHIASATREDLTALLQNVSRGMKRWTFEFNKRTANSAMAKWDVENEYHVQNLLWAVLAPVFPDLDDEENLPSIGHKKPRADLGIRSLRTIIEVKFLRDRGQRSLAKIIEEISADAGLYLSRTTDYDNIVAFVWDDCAQTEQHYELKSGIEQINGISTAIILPRPSIMERQPRT
jgi:REase_DpnII-MboI